MKTIVVGTRSSKLAMVQANLIARYLKTAGFAVVIEPVVTTGDTVRGSLADHGGKGLFVKELEEALLEKRIDLAVHSMKDLPAMLAKDMSIVAVTKREDARDVMISRVARTLKDLPAGARIATSSPRRRAQLMAMRGDLDIVPMRGNIDTRMAKLKGGDAEAIIVAAAGLVRLRIPKVVTQYLPADRFIPAVGQGALAIESRRGDVELARIVQKLCHHVPTATAVRAERAFLKRVGGDCYTPLGAHATLKGSRLALRGFLASPDGARSEISSLEGEARHAADIGKRLADELISKIRGRAIGRRV